VDADLDTLATAYNVATNAHSELQTTMYSVLDCIPDRAPGKLASGCAAWLVEWPNVVAVDEVDTCFRERGNVLIPSRVCCVGGVDAWKDDDGWPSGAYGLANLGESLIVRDGEGELGHSVGGRGYDGVAVDWRMRAFLSRKPGLVTERKTGGGFDLTQLAAFL
jgi:hypothetical protein